MTFLYGTRRRILCDIPTAPGLCYQPRHRGVLLFSGDMNATPVVRPVPIIAPALSGSLFSRTSPGSEAPIRSGSEVIHVSGTPLILKHNLAMQEAARAEFQPYLTSIFTAGSCGMQDLSLSVTVD